MYDRKTWIVLALCGALLALNLHFSSKNNEDRARQAAAENARLAAEQPPIDPLTGEADVVPGLTVETLPPPTDEELVLLENDEVAFTLSTVGGGIKHAEFKNQFKVGDTSTRVRANRFGSGPIGAIVNPGEAIDNSSYTYRAADSELGKSAVFIARLASGLIAKKTYSLDESDTPGAAFFLNLTLEIENTTSANVELSQFSLFLGEAAPLYQKERPDQTGFFWLENNEMHFRNSGKFRGGMFSSEKSIITSPADHNVQFAGVTNQFFATVIRPAQPAITTVWARPTLVTLSAEGRAVTSVRAGLALPQNALVPNNPVTYQYRIFTGPKHNTMLRKMENYERGWGEIMQYGWFWWVSRPLNWLLNNLHVGFDNLSKTQAWGLSIIFLTIIVRIIIWPLHAKSTRTMKRMSKLQPEMAKIKEKYPDDPNKLNQEMMGLYRKFGINPLGGCLPMLIQIPIFFGFYRMLEYAVELRHQPFLWVSDLSQPDTLTHVAGLPINILPIVMAITSFLQIKMMPKTGDKLQQRIIMFMPLMFFFFCYNFASALALYWTTQNIFSIGQTWLMNKIPEPELKARKVSNKKSWVERMAEKQAEMQRLQKERSKNGGNMRNVTPEEPKKKRPPRTGG